MSETMKERASRVRAEAQNVWNFAQLGKSDWIVFRHVTSRCAGVSISEWVVDRRAAAAETGYSPARISNSLQKLEKLGIITRHIEQVDRRTRTSTVHLTAMAAAFCQIGTARAKAARSKSKNEDSMPYQAIVLRANVLYKMAARANGVKPGVFGTRDREKVTHLIPQTSERWGISFDAMFEWGRENDFAFVSEYHWTYAGTFWESVCYWYFSGIRT